MARPVGQNVLVCSTIAYNYVTAWYWGMYARYELHIIHVLPPCLLRMSIQHCTTSLFSFGVSLYIVPCSDSMFSDLCHPAATANTQEPLLLPCSALGRNSVVIPIAAFAALGATSLFGHDDLVDLRVAGWPAKRSRVFLNGIGSSMQVSENSLDIHSCHQYVILCDTGTYTTSSSLCMCQKMPHQKHYKPVQIVELGKSVDTASVDRSGMLSGPTNIIKHPSLLSNNVIPLHWCPSSSWWAFKTVSTASRVKRMAQRFVSIWSKMPFSTALHTSSTC